MAAAANEDHILVIFVDGIDENEGHVAAPPANERMIQRLVMDTVRSQTARRLSIVLSCRTEREARKLLPLGFEALTESVFVTGFDDDELQALASKAHPRTRELMQTALSTRARQHERRGPDSNKESAHPEAIEMLREPAVWAVFSVLTAEQQCMCLCNEPAGLDLLAEQYLERIEQKVNRRVGRLNAYELGEVLGCAAELIQGSEEQSATYEDWLQIGQHIGASIVQAKQLYEECVSAGILHELEGDMISWRWQQMWLYEHFIRRNRTQ